MSKLKAIMAMSLLLGGGMPPIRYNDKDREYQSLRDILHFKPKRKEIFTMVSNWHPIEDTVFSNDIIKLRVDTRDFHMVRTTMETPDRELTKIPKNLDRIRELNASKNHKLLFTIEEIEVILKDLYTRSKGKGEWRYFAFTGKGTDISKGWRLKYFTIIKTEYGYLVYDSKETRALFEYELKSPIIEDKYLSHH